MSTARCECSCLPCICRPEEWTEDDTEHDAQRDDLRNARNARKAEARRAAKALLEQFLDDEDIQIDYDAKVYLPDGGDDGAWVDVRIWVREVKST